jgi:hypothetical protein
LVGRLGMPQGFGARWRALPFPPRVGQPLALQEFANAARRWPSLVRLLTL